MPTSDAVGTVTLKDGLIIPLAALRVLWDLEARGFELVALDGILRVSPRSRITADDAAAIRRHRDELLALVRSSEAIQ